jgi:hypothetical protein
MRRRPRLALVRQRKLSRLPRRPGWLLTLGAGSYPFLRVRLRWGGRIRLLLAIVLLADTVFFSHLSLHMFELLRRCYCKGDAADSLDMLLIITRPVWWFAASGTVLSRHTMCSSVERRRP